jgi:hypothetical protein
VSATNCGPLSREDAADARAGYPALRCPCGAVTTRHTKRVRRTRAQRAEIGLAELAATIKERFSKVADCSDLSNGCQRCDAIQGDWPLAQAIRDHVLGVPLDELGAALARTPRGLVTVSRGSSGFLVLVHL